MTEIQKIIKRIEKQIPRALAEDEKNAAGNDWVAGYEFAVSGMRTLVNKLKKEYE